MLKAHFSSYSRCPKIALVRETDSHSLISRYWSCCYVKLVWDIQTNRDIFVTATVFMLTFNVSKNPFILHLLKEQVMYINVDKKDKYRYIIS